MSDPKTFGPDSMANLTKGTYRYMAPEVLDHVKFYRSTSDPTVKSDIYAFGMTMYHVSATGRISSTVINGSVQVLTGNQPFPNREDDEIKDEVVRGNRPPRPTDPNEPLSEDAKRWLSDGVWKCISRCCHQDRDSRPDVDKVIKALKKAVEEDRKSRAVKFVGQLLGTSKGKGKSQTTP